MTEAISRIGFDWVLIDGEHAPLSLETMQVMFQAMNGTDCTPIIRLAWNDPVLIKRILDIGKHGIPVPWVNTREEADAIVLGSPDFFNDMNSLMTMFLERLWSFRHNRFPLEGKPYAVVSSGGFQVPEGTIE